MADPADSLWVSFTDVRTRSLADTRWPSVQVAER